MPERSSAGKDSLRVILHAWPQEAGAPSTWKETPVTPGSPEAELWGAHPGPGHGKAARPSPLLISSARSKVPLARVPLCDSFRSETAPKIVTASAFSQGKRGSAKQGLTPPGFCCWWMLLVVPREPCTGPGRSILLGQLCGFPRSFSSPQGDRKAGCSYSAVVALAAVPIATDSRGQCHIGTVLSWAAGTRWRVLGFSSGHFSAGWFIPGMITTARAKQSSGQGLWRFKSKFQRAITAPGNGAAASTVPSSSGSEDARVPC